MSVVIPPRVGFCFIDDRTVFLDIRADRYWLAPRPAFRALKAVIASEPLSDADRAALAGLVDAGLIEWDDGTPPPKITRPPKPLCSCIEEYHRTQTTSLIGAFRDTMRASWWLRRGGLAEAFDRLARARKLHLDELPPGARDNIIAGYIALRTWLTPAGRCLPLSLALATRCADPEIKLVIGVKLAPFAAHAWVQRHRQVLNDHADAVRPFTPIYVA